MKLPKDFKRKDLEKGLTFIEIMMIVALVVLFAGIVTPTTLNFYTRQTIGEAEKYLESNIRTARERSIIGKGEGYHGVKFFSSKYVIFEGRDYESRVESKDIVVVLPLGVELEYEDGEEIVFERETGKLITE